MKIDETLIIMPEHIQSVQKRQNVPVAGIARIKNALVIRLAGTDNLAVVDREEISSDFRLWLNRNGFGK